MRTTAGAGGVARLAIAASCSSSIACASVSVSATKRTVSPGRSWPSFQRSAFATTNGQTKPPRLGPSGPSRIGMSPVKSTAPTA